MIIRIRLRTLAIAAIFFLSLSITLRAEEPKTRVTVMTFNVLCSFCDRTNYDPWEERLDYFADIIHRHKPDLIGTQEISKESEVTDISGVIPEYDFFYYKDAPGPKARAYPDQTIYYLRERFELVASGTYWLSATPDEPWTKGWAKVQFWRLVGWVHLREKSTGRDLYFSNTHFDNNVPNQKMSAPLQLERVAPWAAKMPAIVVGDFNSKPDSEAYATLVSGTPVKLQNTYDLTDNHERLANKEPAPELDPNARIDHIWVAGERDYKVSQWSVDLHVYGSQDRFPSDHRALSATIEF